jgi:hypothetical protein
MSDSTARTEVSRRDEPISEVETRVLALDELASNTAA